MLKNDISKGRIVIYKARDKSVQLQVKLERDTVWLNQVQIATLFDKDVRTISEHINNTYKEGELNRAATIRKFRIVRKEGNREVVRSLDFYNLDIIISVGYRVGSKRGTQFRIWATKILKNYLIKGYVLNQKRLVSEQAKKLAELKEAIGFITSKATHPELTGQAQELLRIINEYTSTLTVLYEYDNKSLTISKKKKPHFKLKYEQAKDIVEKIKINICHRGEGSDILGQEISHKFKGAIGSLYQTFDKKDLYSSVEEKAAHLLYFTIKDHPFADGNKRIASLLFIYFLEKNAYLLKQSGEKKFNDNALVAISLLIAASQPKEKDIMVKLITNLLKEE